MVSDTIQTPFPATPEGKAQLLQQLSPFFRNEEAKELLFPIFPDEDETKEPVIAIIVYDPDRNYLADNIASVVRGERLGYGPVNLSSHGKGEEQYA